MAQHATYASSGTDIRGLLADYAPPIAPGVLLELLNADAADGQRVAKLLQAEPALSARVISVINSALFALRQPIHDVPRAVAMLGPARARSLPRTANLLRAIASRLSPHRRRAEPVGDRGSHSLDLSPYRIRCPPTDRANGEPLRRRAIGGARR